MAEGDETEPEMDKWYHLTPDGKADVNSPVAQPVAPEGRWKGLENWLQRFRDGEEWTVLEADLNALEAEVMDLHKSESYYRDAWVSACERLETDKAEVASLRAQLLEFHGWDSDTWRERAEKAEAEVADLRVKAALADRAKPSMAFIFGNAKWAENQAVVREWLADYEATKKDIHNAS